MSSFIKTKLKAARDLITKKDYAKAREAAAEVLSYEPDNYNANVFLGLACLELGEHEQSEQAYRKAIDSNPNQMLAWTGLSKYYEQTSNWDKYGETLRSMSDIYAKSDDAVKCAEVLQKYIEFWRQRGTRIDLNRALSLLLPESPLYPTLSSLPPPDPTAPTASTIFMVQSAIQNSLPILEEMVTLTEKEESETLQKEVNKRRQRLGSAGPEELRKQVGLEIWGSSQLPKLYNTIINHLYTTDELRRSTESKLLEFLYRYQCALPLIGVSGLQKSEIGKQVQDLIDGIVLLKIPNSLAWSLYIEGKDVDQIDGYGLDNLRHYIQLFPETALARLMKSYLIYNGYELRRGEDEENGEVENEEIDGLDLMLDAFANVPDSIFAHRVIGDIYLEDEDYQNVIAVGERGLELVRRHELNTGLRLTQVRKAFNVILATGLVHLFPPKHHPRAIRVLGDVLSLEPENIPCLMGRGYVLQASGEWEEAAKLFMIVANKEPDDINTGFVAKEEYAWCLFQLDRLAPAAEELQQVLDLLEEWDGYETRKARLWWRLGYCYWKMEGNKREKAYSNFITALKRSPSFAPAFTSLGIYYLEFADPPDPTRASKCFQKAFELDPRETDAARRLAHSFADEREWDLVEVVARRTIEGEGGLEGGLGSAEASAIAKHKPTNVWAWKALGVVELNRRGYSSAIQAFQVALRSDERDALSWLRLGEAYSKAGRHAAALKALNKSRELQPDDWMCIYHIGEVQRQTGQLPEAILTFKSILEMEAGEIVVLLSLAETYLELGREELSSGFLGRASASFLFSISTSLELVTSSPGFRRLAWKTISDSLYALSGFSALIDSDIASSVFKKVENLASSHSRERLKGIVEFSASTASLHSGSYALQLATVSYDYRLSLFSMKEAGLAHAWFDLGVSLFRIASQSKSSSVQESAIKQAVESIRQALTNDPGHAIFWIAFGNLHFEKDVAIAQHAYIRALEIDHKDASVWANLGLLYLYNNDLVLANEALLKAQTLDPDFTLAWVGQGLVAAANGHEEDASLLFEHAIGLTADLPDADFEYAFRAFNKLQRLQTRSTLPTRELYIPPFFTLDRFCRRKSNDPSALHLFGLVCERLHLKELGIQLLSSAIGYLETMYEESEDPQIERHYAIANANLGRLLLSVHRYDDADEAFGTSFGLLPEEGEESIIALRVLCQFGSGIAKFKLDSLQEAMQNFDSALAIASSSSKLQGHVTVMLTQALWAMGGEDSQDAAKSQLFQCINADPENISAITTLAGMGLLTNDESLIEAAVAEVTSLPIDDRHQRDPNRDVERLLVNHHLAEGQMRKANSVIQRSIHEEPPRFESRELLASLSICQGRSEIAQALLSRLYQTSQTYNDSNLHNALRTLAIASKCQPELARKVAQRAVNIAPWDGRNWWCLAFAEECK